MKIKVMILCVNNVEKIREVIKNDIVHVVLLFSPFLFLSFPPLFFFSPGRAVPFAPFLAEWLR